MILFCSVVICYAIIIHDAGEFTVGDKIGIFFGTIIIGMLCLSGMEQCSKQTLIETKNLDFVMAEKPDRINLIVDNDAILHIRDYESIKRIKDNKIKVISQKHAYELDFFSQTDTRIKVIDLETDKELHSQGY